jgi:hypothetical protein
VDGKRKPAAVRGEMNPMIPSGGIVVATKANGTRKMYFLVRSVHATVHGTESRIAARSHTANGMSGLADDPT